MSCLFQGSTACSHIVEHLQVTLHLLFKMCIVWGTLQVSQCLKNCHPAPLLAYFHANNKWKEKKRSMATSQFCGTWKPRVRMTLSFHLSVWDIAQVCTGTFRKGKGTGLIKIKLVSVNDDISPKHSHHAYHLSCFWLHMSAYDLVLAWIKDVEWHLNI